MDNSQIDELKNRIIELSIQCISDLKNQNIPYDAFHSELQKLLADKSVLFNLSSRREYPTIINNEKYGFLDLVWLDEQKPIVAFEIDSNFYINSVWKLLNINADLRFWIYYNQMTEDELFIFRGKNKDKLITLVKLPVSFDIKPEELKRIENYYNRSITRRKSNSVWPGNTLELTYNLLQKDLTIDEIAIERGLSRYRIIYHIKRLHQMGCDINIDNFLPKDKQDIENYYRFKQWKTNNKENKAIKKLISQQRENTALNTYELLQKDLTIDEIAKERGLSRSTIVEHITRLIHMNYQINIDNFVTKEKQDNIRNAFKKLNTINLKEIKNFLGETYSYDEIRLVMSQITPQQ
jgi:predicted DNA-binding protein YlxM (UPF0122 family)